MDLSAERMIELEGNLCDPKEQVIVRMYTSCLNVLPSETEQELWLEWLCFIDRKKF